MPQNLDLELSKISQQPQRQDAAIEQLQDLLPFANRLGLYDAADLIRTIVSSERWRESLTAGG